ncbi:hypothetical protein [Actinoplanes sp. L3-i22]|uniref:hypothetical protein n=1 Tax=Actinoplanes sp. L3-i22 TaxID=2836373 RepID=UPI001C84AC7A|nr:hypothetical protein [Actinoplanes sp. L3-i22]
MRTEFVDGEYVLRLSRPEIVTIISGMAAADGLEPDDLAFAERVGETRPDYRDFVNQVADFCRSIEI